MQGQRSLPGGSKHSGSDTRSVWVLCMAPLNHTGHIHSLQLTRCRREGTQPAMCACTHMHASTDKQEHTNGRACASTDKQEDKQEQTSKNTQEYMNTHTNTHTHYTHTTSSIPDSGFLKARGGLVLYLPPLVFLFCMPPSLWCFFLTVMDTGPHIEAAFPTCMITHPLWGC